MPNAGGKYTYLSHSVSNSPISTGRAVYIYFAKVCFCVISSSVFEDTAGTTVAEKRPESERDGARKREGGRGGVGRGGGGGQRERERIRYFFVLFLLSDNTSFENSNKKKTRPESFLFFFFHVLFFCFTKGARG